MTPSDRFSHWQEIRAGLNDMVEKFDTDQMGYASFPGAYTVAEILLHIADAEEGWFRYVILKEYDEWPAQFTVENYPTVEAIKNALTAVHKKTESYLDSLTEADLKQKIKAPWGSEYELDWIIWHVLEHEVHHRGELSLILGFLGKEGWGA